MQTELGAYYTLPDVSRFLVGSFETYAPRSVLDLGSGGGSLTHAAAERWPAAGFVTSDVDPAVPMALSRMPRHEHHVVDVLDAGLPLTLGSRRFDVVLSNPPYMRTPWRPEFATILSEAGLEGLPRECVTAEVVFVAQALRLAATGAEIGLILPDGVVCGDRFKEFRQRLLARAALRRAVRLPRRSFVGTEARACAVTLRNCPPDGSSVTVDRLEPGQPPCPLEIPVSEAASRMDWEYHWARPRGQSFTLRSLGATVLRGSISSSEARTSKHPTFHTTDFPEAGVEHALPDCLDHEAEGRFAVRGDILLARVHRNLERKLCMVSSGRAEITDCVYAIRVPEESRKLAFDAMRHPAGAASLRRASRGVGARMLAKKELLGLEFEISF
jgi:type I restriction enzyme M protein